MDISLVREKFQKPWNFNIVTDYSGDVSHWYYSFQEESLNSDDKLLYITAPERPDILGHLLELDGQRWIVWKLYREHFNKKLWQVLLLPSLDTLVLKTVPIASNALGSVPTTGDIKEYIIDVFIEDYGLKERTVPTAQPVESFQNVFYAAEKQFPKAEVFEAYYQDKKYKVDSLERNIGAVKIRATEDF